MFPDVESVDFGNNRENSSCGYQFQNVERVGRLVVGSLTTAVAGCQIRGVYNSRQ